MAGYRRNTPAEYKLRSTGIFLLLVQQKTFVQASSAAYCSEKTAFIANYLHRRLKKTFLEPRLLRCLLW